MRYELKQCPVVFDKERHTYDYDGNRLSGITSVLKRQLFADKYDGVSDEILAKAAEHGTYVHSMCELADRMGITDGCPEATAYLRLCYENGLTTVASEYLISDLEYYASSIDKVFAGKADNKFEIGDIKSTYTLDKDYLRWQLSVYAYIFEKQNPGAKVTRLYGIWLRGDKAELCELERIGNDTIFDLLESDAHGRKFVNTLPMISDGQPLPEKYRAIEDTLIGMQMQYDYLKKQLDRFKAECLTLMDEGGVKKFASDRLILTRRADSTRESFDTARFKAEHPELYKEYTKTTTAKGGVTIKIK